MKTRAANLCGCAIGVVMAGCLTVSAGVPVRWTAETSRVQPQMLEAWRGDALDMEVTLTSYGRPLSLGAATASLMWQTNGMAEAWWQTNATVSADGVITARWTPEMDPGAQEVAFFLPVQSAGGPSYRAAGRIRFRPSPGAGSRTLPLPQPGGTLDFGDYQLVNAPWATLEAADAAIAAAVTSATGALVIPPAVDLSPYATTAVVAQAVQSACNGLSAAIQAATNGVAALIPSLDGYATVQDVADAIAGIRLPSLEGYATTAYADAVASNAQAAAIAQIPSLDGYATVQDVADAIAGIRPPSLDGYATTAYADAVASNAQAAAVAQIPSLDGYATVQDVADAIAGIRPPSLDGYATTAYADAVASNAQAAAVAQIPSLAGYATVQDVADAIAGIQLPSLDGYATTAYADAVASNAQAAAVAHIPSLDGYATQADVVDYVDGRLAQGVVIEAQTTRLATPDGLIWQDATGVVWQARAIIGFSGSVWTNSHAYSAASTGVTQEVTFWPAPVDAGWDAAATWTNAAFGRIALVPASGGSMALTWEPGPLGSGIPQANVAGIGETNKFIWGAGEIAPGVWASLDINLGRLGVDVTNAVDRVLYMSEAATETVMRAEVGQNGRRIVTNDVSFTGRYFSVNGPSVVSFKAAPGRYVTSLSAFRIGSPGDASATLSFADRIYFDLTNYPASPPYYGSPRVRIGRPVDGISPITIGDEEVATKPDATNAAVAVADAKISTNNSAFVSAVLAAPLAGASSEDIAEIAEYGGYGTVGAALLALIAGLAALKRRVAGKADASDLLYALVTPGEWTFSDGGSYVISDVIEGSDGWYFSLDGISPSEPAFNTRAEAESSLVLNFPYVGITATRASLPGHLLDRAGNRVEVSGDTTLTLPAAVPGYLRDFLVRLEISGSTVPTITFQGQGSEAPNGADEITYETDGDEFPVPDEAGSWLYSFTESCVAHKFAVSLKKVNPVAQGGS